MNDRFGALERDVWRGRPARGAENVAPFVDWNRTSRSAGTPPRLILALGITLMTLVPLATFGGFATVFWATPSLASHLASSETPLRAFSTSPAGDQFGISPTSSCVIFSVTRAPALFARCTYTTLEQDARWERSRAEAGRWRSPDRGPSFRQPSDLPS
jgi:hypothetical protein